MTEKITPDKLFRPDRYDPKRAAVVTYSEQMTYGELFERAAALNLSGIKAVAVLDDVSTDFLVLLYACLIHGATLIVLSPAYTSDQIDKILEDTLPDIILSPDKYKDKLKSDSLEQFVRSGITDLSETDLNKNSMIPDGIFLILFTSGSTGEPKGVCLTKENLLTDMYSIGRSYIHLPDSVYLHIMPFYHIFGIISAMTTLWECGTLCIGSGIKAMMQDIEHFSPTALDIVPEAASYLLKRAKYDGTGVLGGRLRTILCGGAQVPKEIVEQWKGFGITVWGCYGMTECSSCVCFADSDCTPGCAGKPIDCNKVCIGRDGIVYVSGKNVMQGYLNNDRSRFSDEWFCTGDYGYFNERGELFITGRSDKLITSKGGENIPFAQIKKIILSNECVTDAEMLHKRDENGRSIAVIYIHITNEANEEEFMKWKDKILGSLLSSTKCILCRENEYLNDKILGTEISME